MDGLTVSILNFNGKEVLPECIEAILNQEKPKEFELQIVDNASTDGSEKEAFVKYPIDALIREKNEYQFITGLNATFKYAKYENVLFVSNDTILQDGAIMNLYNISQKFQPCIVQPVFLEQSGKIQNAGMRMKWPGYGFADKSAGEFDPVSETEVFATGCFLMTRSIFKLVGRFDEELSPAFYEDVDYSLRAKRLGVKLLVDSSARVKHYTSYSFSKVYSKRDISKACHKNRVYVIKKHYRGLSMLTRVAVVNIIDMINHVIQLKYI